MKNKSDNGKILSFGQNADFYIRQGDRRAEEENLLGAIQSYRTALEMEPDNADACFALSEALNEAQRYEESNRLLMVFMCTFGSIPDFFYGIACNFYGMDDFEYAYQAAETYLMMDGKGPYADQTEELIDLLSDDSELSATLMLDENDSSIALNACARARFQLAGGEAGKAVETLREYLKEDPGSWRAKVSLALALYINEEKEEAFSVLDKVCAEKPYHVDAGILRIRLLLNEGKRTEALKEAEQIRRDEIDTLDMMVSFADALTRLGKTEEALETVETALEYLPFDREALHLRGYLAHEAGDLDKAAECYRTLETVGTDDTVAGYFLKVIGEEKKGSRNPGKFPVEYRVSIPEQVRRENLVREYLDMETPELQKLFNEDREAGQTILWALRYGSPVLRKEILEQFSEMSDRKSEMTLRESILWTDQTDEAKRTAMIAMDIRKLDSPYMACINGRWVDARMVPVTGTEKLPESFERIADRVIDRFRDDASEDKTAGFVRYVLGMYVKLAGEKDLKLSKPQEDAMAAAVELLSAKMTGAEPDLTAVMKAYGVTETRLDNAVGKLLKTLGIEVMD